MLAIISLFIECAICAVLKTLGIDPISDVLAVALVCVFSIAFIIDVSNDEKQKYSGCIICGYLLRVFLLFFDYFGKSIYHLPNSGADTEMFYKYSVMLANGLTSEKYGGFIGLFGRVFSIIGTSRLYGQFIVMLFSIIALLVIIKTIEELSISNEQKIRAVSLVSIIPNYAILSSIFLRESIVSMFVSISLYMFIQYYKGNSYIYLVFCYASVLLGMVFHSGIAGFLIGYGIIILIHQNGMEENRTGFIRVLIASLACGISLFLFINYKDVLFAKFLSVNDITDVANTVARGGSTYAKYVGDSTSILNVLVYTLPRFAYFLFSPFPWQWRGGADLIAFFFSGLYYLGIVIISFGKLFNSKTQYRALLKNMLIIMFCSTFVFAWGVSNVGTAVRHRDKLISVFAVLHALCYDYDKGWHIIVGDKEII